jgi:hypothetical protein
VWASLTHGGQTALNELITLERMLTRRAGDVLGFFDLHGTSNGPRSAERGRAASAGE